MAIYGALIGDSSCVSVTMVFIRENAMGLDDSDTYDGEIYRVDGELIPGTAESEVMGEQEIAQVVQRYLEGGGYAAYPEVSLRHFAGRPDLIAVRNSLCAVYECKTSLTFGLVAQACAWHSAQEQKCGMPHLIWLVVGAKRGRTTYAEEGLLWQVIKQHRLGILEVSKRARHTFAKGTDYEERSEVTYRLHLKRYAQIQPGSRQSARLLIGQLNDDMRVAVPGSRGGQTLYMTDFKRTTIKMALLMRDEQPRSLKEIVVALGQRGGHHYSSDASAVSALRSHMTRLGYVRDDGAIERFLLSQERADRFLAEHRGRGA